MSAQTVQSHQPSCFWRVQAVFDADGLGGDFAYTIGLHSVGLPELHLWARPTCGDDPAPDWKFSSRDLGALLNEFARLQLGGDLVVGSVVERSFDGGMARVRFEVDPPGDRAALEALGIAARRIGSADSLVAGSHDARVNLASLTMKHSRRPPWSMRRWYSGSHPSELPQAGGSTRGRHSPQGNVSDH